MDCLSGHPPRKSQGVILWMVGVMGRCFGMVVFFVFLGLEAFLVLHEFLFHQEVIFDALELEETQFAFGVGSDAGEFCS